MVLTKQTYNNQDKHKKPKETPKTKPKKTKLTLVQSPLMTSDQETDRAYSNKNYSSQSQHRAINIQNSHSHGTHMHQPASYAQFITVPT